MGLAYPAILFWDKGLFVRMSVPIIDRGAVIGRLVMEEALPLITHQMMSDEGLGATGETGLCKPKRDHMLCYPQSRNPGIYRARLISDTGKPTPMALALQGKTGVFKGVDYRGNPVIAAYAPLLGNRLGIIVKKDTKELFEPIREQLQWSLPLLLLLTGIGAALLHVQIKPLAAKLLRSEEVANEKELRLRSIINGVGEGIITLDESGTIQSFNGAAAEIFGYNADDMIGKNIQMLMPAEMRPLHDNGMKRYLAGGAPKVIGQKNVELPGLHKDGAKR